MPVTSKFSSNIRLDVTFKSSTQYEVIDDSHAGTSADDKILGGSGYSYIDGGAGNDFIDGGLGNDYLIGNEGSDTLIGGNGNDKLYGDYSYYEYPEYWNDYTDYLYGGAGNDYLDGGLGADVMYGGSGNDIYIVDNAGDVVSEKTNAGFGIFTDAGGIDEVRTSLDQYTLGDNVENLTFLPKNSGNISLKNSGHNGYGNALDNVITGAAGNDALNGGDGNDTLIGNAGHDRLAGDAGADVMIGGTGNDVYEVDNVGDQVIERAGEGTDTVVTSLSEYALGDNIENLSGGTSAGVSHAFHGVGNDLDNVINGSGGDDTLEGGAGNDTLKGGGGADTYVFADGDTGHDRVIGFDEAEGDVLDFSGMTGVTDFASLTITTDAYGDAVVSYGETSVTLAGVDAASLDGSEFLFAQQDPAAAGDLSAEDELALNEEPAAEVVEDAGPIAVDDPGVPFGIEEPGQILENII